MRIFYFVILFSSFSCLAMQRHDISRSERIRNNIRQFFDRFRARRDRVLRRVISERVHRRRFRLQRKKASSVHDVLSMPASQSVEFSYDARRSLSSCSSRSLEMFDVPLD